MLTRLCFTDAALHDSACRFIRDEEETGEQVGFLLISAVPVATPKFIDGNVWLVQQQAMR